MEGSRVNSSAILPRVLLLEALYFNVERLHSELAGQNKWDSFRSGLVAALKATRDEVLQELPQDTELRRVVEHVVERKYSAVLLAEEVRKHYEKMMASSNKSATALAESTTLARFVHAFDRHIVAFLNKDAYVSTLVCLVSVSEFLKTVSSPSGKFLDTYDSTSMPAPQQFGFLATGLLLNGDLIHRLQDAGYLSPHDAATTGRAAFTRTSALTTVFYVANTSDNDDSTTLIKGDGSLDDLAYSKVEANIKGDGTIPTNIDDVEIQSQEDMHHNHTQFIQSINSYLASLDEEGSSNPTMDVLIFIHGFMATAGKDDVQRVAQLKHDMSFSGAAIAYRWPSKGNAFEYFEDEKAVADTIPYLANFIKLCINQVKARRLHILAHSMGNRAMIGALGQIYKEIENGGDGNWIQTGLPLKNVIAAAADSIVEDFQDMVNGAKQIFKVDNEYRPVFSVYTSEDDRALWASWVAHQWQIRLGLTQAHFEEGTVTLSEPEFVDVIDATGFSNSIHMYFCEEKSVLQDLQQLTSVSGKERAYLRASDASGVIHKVTHVADNGETVELYAFDPSQWPSPSASSIM